MAPVFGTIVYLSGFKQGLGAQYRLNGRWRFYGLNVANGNTWILTRNNLTVNTGMLYLAPGLMQPQIMGVIPYRSMSARNLVKRNRGGRNNLARGRAAKRTQTV